MKALIGNRIAVALIACGVSPLLHADPPTDAQAAVARTDCEAALRTWREWAQQGNAEAQTFVASLYVRGQGVAKDYDEAARLLRRAAEQGLASAQYQLSLPYLEGRGVKDDAEAVLWNRKAAEQGFAPAQHNLGSQVINGRRGVTKDEAEGVRWFQKAAKQGWVPSQRSLVAVYLQGQGVPKDLVQAYKWMTVAMEGTQVGTERLQTGRARDEIAKSMTHDQVEQASQLAREWMETGTAIYTDSRFARLGEAYGVTAGQVVAARAYAVTAPVGDGWNVQVDRYNDVVTFTKGQQPTNAADLERIIVGRREVGLAAAARNEIDLATAIECSEEANLKEEGKIKSYMLGEVTKQIATIDGKTLYVMSYVITDRRLLTAVEVKYVAYTFLPSNWKESKRAYTFVIGQPQNIGDTAIATHASEIQSVISGFREK